MPTYPVTFEADYVETRDRVTVFFRLILAIPILFWVWLYSIAATVAIVIAWFALVITGRYPDGLYDFVAGYTRLLTRATAYTLLVCDPYPSFMGEDDSRYPVRMRFAGPLQEYSRVKAGFRFILAIPILILRYVLALLLEVAAIAAWFVILVLGRLPAGLFDVMVLATSYTARADAYIFLLTETYPPFEDESQTAVAGQADTPGV